MNYIKLISIDCSTKKTGIAFFYNGIYDSHSLLNYSKYKDTDERQAAMAKGILEMLNTFSPNAVFIEETYMAQNAQTTKLLTRLQGVVYGWCLVNNAKFYTIRPTQWRKALGFVQNKNVKRKELKQQSIDYVEKKYRLKVTDDEADAICIADAAIKILKEKGEQYDQ